MNFFRDINFYDLIRKEEPKTNLLSELQILLSLTYEALLKLYVQWDFNLLCPV